MSGEGENWHEITYEVTIRVPDENDGDPDPLEIKRAIVQGIAVSDINDQSLVDVVRL